MHFRRSSGRPRKAPSPSLRASVLEASAANKILSPGLTWSNPGMTPCVRQRNRKVLQSSRGRNLPTTSSNRRPSPSRSRPNPRRNRSLPSRSLESQRRSLCSLESQRRSLESRPRSLESRRHSLCPRSLRRVRSRSLEQRLVCPTGSFRGCLCRRDGTSPG